MGYIVRYSGRGVFFRIFFFGLFFFPFSQPVWVVSFSPRGRLVNHSHGLLAISCGHGPSNKHTHHGGGEGRKQAEAAIGGSVVIIWGIL